MFSLIFIERDEEIKEENLIKQPPPEYEPDVVSFCTFL
jgi:hypothetical protein